MSTPTNPHPVLNPRPKVRFQLSNNNVGTHRDLVDRPEFQRAADFSLLEYQAKLCEREQNPTVIGLKLSGAQEFLQEMRLLSEKPDFRPPVKISDNLSPQ